MAVLSDVDRQALWAEFMSMSSSERDSLGVTKSDLRAAVNSIDDWVNSNAASMNAAVPEPARSALTPTQKARLLTFVVRRRWEVG
jgi:hypothetical protein